MVFSLHYLISNNIRLVAFFTCVRRGMRGWCLKLKAPRLTRTFFLRSTKVCEPFDKSYVVIYRLPAVPILGTAIKSKSNIYGFISLVVLFITILHYKGRLSLGQYTASLCSCVVFLIIFSFVLSLSRNIIGKIYISIVKNEMILSYLNGRGCRVNIFTMPDSLKVSEHPNFITKKLCKQITVNGSDVKFNLYCGRGIVTNYLACCKYIPDLF